MARKKREDESLCWRCERAAGARMCSWARALTPVAGWQAEATHWQEQDESGMHTVHSACVKRCPLYEPDRGEREALQRQAYEQTFAELVQADRTREEGQA